MSAANEKAVAVFLEGKIGYLDIVPLVEATCEAHVPELKVITPLPTCLGSLLNKQEWVVADGRTGFQFVAFQPLG
jgi:1-deoxy-D-xylulose 5-phosphate reductoisomerase